MINKKSLSVVVIFILIFGIACEKALDNYVHLEYTDFMKLSNDVIADSLATILNVAPVTYSQNVPVWELLHKTLVWVVKEGYKYIADDSAKIIVWVDEEDNPYFVTYELRRNGTSEDWSYEEDSIISEFTSNVEKAGVDLDCPHNLNLNKIAGFGDHWYELSLTQTYHDTAVKFPYFYSETESDTNKVNCLLVSRWYTNLDDITDILSDQTLKEKAREYFENSEKVDSILENLTVEGYYVIKDKLCVEIGSAIIDEYGSRLYLYIDVQNGEVVGEEALYVRSCMWIDRNAINRPLKSKSSLKLGNNFWD